MNDFSIEDIAGYLQNNPGMTDVQIADAMRQYNVSPERVSLATGVPVTEVSKRYQEATYGGSGIPPRPTFSGVAAAWNTDHLAQFGTFLNTATASGESVGNQADQLRQATKLAQEQWDSTYGNTPEGRIAKENPLPDWRDFYNDYAKASVERFGNIINRPWMADQDSIKTKLELDAKYVNAVKEYNEKNGTNFSPDPYVLGAFAQPNEFYNAPKKDKWYDNPFKVAAAVAAVYFGGQALGGLLGGGGATAAGTGAFDAGIGLDAMLGGAGASGGAAAGAAAGTGAFDAGIGLDAMSGGQGLVGGINQGISIPSAFETAMPGGVGGNAGQIGPVGNFGFGSSVPTTAQTAASLQAAGFAPGTAANLAGQTLAGTGAAMSAPTISITDALRTTNSLSKLGQQPQQQQQPQQGSADQNRQMGVDYSDLLNLLALQAKTSGLLGTQFQPQTPNLSLLG